MTLYYILLIDKDLDLLSDDLVELKKLIFHLFYVDNGAITFHSADKMLWAYKTLSSIFSPYKFDIQQVVTNCSITQNLINEKFGCESVGETKLLGLHWDTDQDKLSCVNLFLDSNASTKRQILSSIASNYDLLGINLPLLNRARLFMHKLQTSLAISWDSKLKDSDLSEWKNIAKQYNKNPKVTLDRSFGRRDDKYDLIAYTDSSQQIYGTVLFLNNLNSGKITFLLAKNRIVNKQQEKKTIPVLELQGVSFGTEVLLDIYEELSGKNCLFPIDIRELKVYSDSSISLSWIEDYSLKFSKMNDKSVYVRNRLEHISKLCKIKPVKFCFCTGVANPADAVTRAFSYKSLSNTTFMTGAIVDDSNEFIRPAITVPNPMLKVQLQSCILESSGENPSVPPPNCTPLSGIQDAPNLSDIVNFERFSSFNKAVNVVKNVLKFANLLKIRLNEKQSEIKLEIIDFLKLESEAYKLLIITHQKVEYGEVVSYFKAKNKIIQRKVPEIVDRFNIFMDKDGILKVKAKFKRWYCKEKFPILLSKDSYITELIVSEYHKQVFHGGIYNVLAEFRKSYYVPHCFSVIKRVLKKCIICKRVNSRAINLNQNSYRDFRSEPPEIPYRSVFIDYIGPYSIRYNGQKQKVYLLLITCLWSRSINLKICMDLTATNFLRSFQLHVFDFGLPSKIISDSGSQLVSSAKVLTH